nr:lipopolysaccharide transport periplasmic protein LptA [Gammaproteobacteria bacterium]
MRFVNTLPLILSLGAPLGSAAAWALPSDRDQPIRIQADSAELDERKGTAVYRGDVVITQGTLKITGDTVTARQLPGGEIESFTSVGQPAYYEQIPDVDKELVQAYGITIEYFARDNRIVITDQAKVVQ